MRRRLTVTLALTLTLAFVAAGCSSDSKTDTSASASNATSSAPVTGTMTVSAAASLTGAFGAIKADFVKANPGANVTINFGSSGQLETQVESGAPVDVAAFADEATMQKLANKSLLAGPSQIFATNSLVIVTKPGNPKNMKSLADLATAGTISLCATTAPCGTYADQILMTAGVSIPASSVTRGQSVKSTLAAVTYGDADAAIVYVTDAQAAGSRVDTVTIPPAQNAVAKYPIAVIKATKSEALARAFISYVLGPGAQSVLEDAGFQAP
jgi:molybdate transport system substrate-binding protein